MKSSFFQEYINFSLISLGLNHAIQNLIITRFFYTPHGYRIGDGGSVGTPSPGENDEYVAILPRKNGSPGFFMFPITIPAIMAIIKTREIHFKL